MKLTAQDYRNAIGIRAEWYASDQHFINKCNERIAELEKPASKRYKCIKEATGSTRLTDYVYAIGGIHDENSRIGDFLVQELPFHFELIPELVKKEPITMAEVFDRLGSCFSHETQKLRALYYEIQEDHNL